jgi:hypothetical protein
MAPEADSAEAEAVTKQPKKSKQPVMELTPKKTALGDTATIKRLMDDAAIAVVLDEEEGHGYVEDTSMSNLKLIIGFAGVGGSLLSHVYPATFPRNWWVLLACCSFYFAMSGVLQLLLSFVELESIIVVRGKTRADGSKRPGINISSHFPRFQEMFTLGVTPISGGAFTMYSSPKFRPDLEGGNTARLCMQRSWSVEKFFDEEGLFAEELFMDAVRDFFAEYERMLQADDSSAAKKTQ